ncbi:MAG: DNA mismatch repair protein MutS, partial [Methylocystaceae bacterium]|nr:DNA mismatch repair protein MutS [Methylocystaceae bacterium]
MGARLLRRWLQAPLRNHGAINARLDAVSFLLNEQRALHIHEIFSSLHDVERITTRIVLRTVRPRELVKLRASLKHLPVIRRLIQDAPGLLHQCYTNLQEFPELIALLERALIDNPPMVIRDGGVLADGYDSELDALRALKNGALDFLAQLEAEEKEKTGLTHLKVGYNSVHGYYIELPRVQAQSAPAHYQRRQTLKNAERFITPELKIFEDKVLSSQERALAREKALYEALLEEISSQANRLRDTSEALAHLDVLSAFSMLAQRNTYTRPILSNEPELIFEAARHPVVERLLQGPFVPNSIHLTRSTPLWLITGPNMGGKSTFMRQTALLVVMAHIG